MSKVNKDEVIKCTLVLFLICLVVTGLLAGTYVLTKEPIDAAAREAAANARAAVLPADFYLEAENYENTDLTVDGKSVGISEVYTAHAADGTALGCVVTSSSKGYGGEIEVMVGVLSTGNVCGVRILSISETAGVGMKVDDPDHLGQYVTFTLDEISESDIPTPAVSSEITEYILDSGDESRYVDAISGATISSSAVNRAVNGALQIYNKMAADGVIIAAVPQSTPVQDALPASAADAAPVITIPEQGGAQ